MSLSITFTIPESYLPLIVVRGDPLDVEGAQAVEGTAATSTTQAATTGGQRVTAVVTGGQVVQGEV